MTEPEKQAQNGVRQPEKVHIPTSKYNIRDRDLEAGLTQSPSVLASNYGMSAGDQPLQPPRRVPSQRSLRHFQSSTSLHSTPRNRNDSLAPATGTNDENDGGVEEELAWGPSHPCFPHMNPHVPVTSPEFNATRIIRVRRDWMVVGDLAPTFSNIYPEILDPLLQEQEFRFVIQHINETLVKTFDPFATWNWIDGILGLMTGWFWEDIRPIGVKGQLKALEHWIEEWNHKVGARDGVKIIPLRRTAYMNLDIQIPDPQVRVIEQVENEQPNDTPNFEQQ